MTGTQTHPFNRSDIVILMRTFGGSIARTLSLTNLKWLLFTLLNIHLGFFGIVELCSGRIFRFLQVLLAPWLAYFLFFNLHPGMKLLGLLLKLTAALIAFFWGLYNIRNLHETCDGSRDITPRKRAQEADSERSIIAHSFHAITGVMLFALVILYYQFLAVNYADIPILNSIIEMVKSLLGALPHIGQV